MKLSSPKPDAMNDSNGAICLAERFLSLSQSMLSAAQSAQWDELEGMETRRKQMALRLFDHLRTGYLDDRGLVPLLREAQRISDALVQLVAEERQRLGQDLRRLRNTRKAESAYAIASHGAPSE